MVDKIRYIALANDVFQDVLTSNSTVQALTANQGNVLAANIATLQGVTGSLDDVYLRKTGNVFVLSTSAITLGNANSGQMILFTNGVTNTIITLDRNAVPGTAVTAIQGNTKNLRFQTTGAATLGHRQGFKNTAGLYAAVSVAVFQNQNGNNALWLLMGDLVE